MALYVGARTILLEEVLEEVRGSEPDLTDHGPRHIAHVLANVFKLLDGDLDHFTPIEHYVLALSVLFHDVGNVYGRKGHNKRIGRVYDHVRRADKFAQEKALIVQIAQAHTGEARDGSRNTLADVPVVSQLDGEPVKAREIAAIVRFADELAEGRKRTSEYMKRHGKYDAESLPYHDYAAATDIAIDKFNNRIAVTYHLGITTDVGLDSELRRVKAFLTFACHRLAKMDLERRYARFHCGPPLARFRTISVRLNIQIDGEFLDPLEATISDDVNWEAPLDLLHERDNDWHPDAVVTRIAQAVQQRKEDEGK